MTHDRIIYFQPPPTIIANGFQMFYFQYLDWHITAKFTYNPPPTTLLADVVGFRCVTFHIFLLNSLGNNDKSIIYFQKTWWRYLFIRELRVWSRKYHFSTPPRLLPGGRGKEWYFLDRSLNSLGNKKICWFSCMLECLVRCLIEG